MYIFNESSFSSLVLFVIWNLNREFLFCYIINRTSDAFTFAFEFVIFSHFLQENIMVCSGYIYSPFTFKTKTKEGFFVNLKVILKVQQQ